MRYSLPGWLRYGLAAAYAYGAAVHVANILGHNGFDWAHAPQRWQVLDVVYLVLDAVVVWGLIFRLRVGLVALVFAAGSQIVLYTMLRGWILDVPSAFVPTPQEQAYITGLVVFHITTLTAVFFVLLHKGNALKSLFILALLAFVPPSPAANRQTVNGVWASPGLAMVVRFEPCDENRARSCGRFLWSWDGDDSLKHKIGSLVLRDIRPDGKHWRGSLIDPSSGRTYRGTLQQIDENTLLLRGCFGPFCQSQTWRSVNSLTADLLGILRKS